MQPCETLKKQLLKKKTGLSKAKRAIEYQIDALGGKLHTPFSSIFSCTPCARIYADHRQNETAGDDDDILRAADIGQDGSVVLAGSGADNFRVFKLDADGSLVWHFEVQILRRSLPRCRLHDMSTRHASRLTRFG